jgi:hypothetical protein
MANFRFNITESSFKVERQPDLVTECSTIFTWRVTSSASNLIRFNVGQIQQYYSNAFYKISEVEYPFDHTADVTVSFSTDLYISFSLGNSGSPGSFHKCLLNVYDDTTSETYNEYNDKVSRDNDNLACDNPTGEGGTYDELLDTPDNKTGSALKIVRINAAETGFEYVDLGSLGNDLNYTHVQSSSSLSWVINHNLGKVPSVTVNDPAKNTVHGDIIHTSLNSLTINFNSAFSGTAYLN